MIFSERLYTNCLKLYISHSPVTPRAMDRDRGNEDGIDYKWLYFENSFSSQNRSHWGAYEVEKSYEGTWEYFVLTSQAHRHNKLFYIKLSGHYRQLLIRTWIRSFLESRPSLFLIDHLVFNDKRWRADALTPSNGSNNEKAKQTASKNATLAAQGYRT